MKGMQIRKLAVLFLAMLMLAGMVMPAAADEVVINVQFSGVINVVPANPGDPWQIAGHTVAVDDQTQVILSTGEPAEPGMWATVQARRLEDDSLLAVRIIVRPPEMRLRGPVQTIPEGGLGEWVIAGQTFLVDENTQIGQRSGEITVGGWVEVVAVEDPAGTLKAVRMHNIEPAEDVELHGAIQAFGANWLISAVPVATDASTLVLDEPEIGLLATALATLRPDNTLLARAIKVSWAEPGRTRPRQPVQFRGTIEALPEGGLIGTWIISGKAVQVTEATRIFQVKGQVAVGAEVFVIGWQQDGVITAGVITVLRSPLIGGPRFQLRGVIEQLPNGHPRFPLVGTWVISGQEVVVQLNTRIINRENVRVGAEVEVVGIQLRNGTKVATSVTVLN